MEPQLFGSGGGSLVTMGNRTLDWFSDYLDFGYLDYNVSDVVMGGEECVGAGLGLRLGVLRAVLYCTVLLVGVPGNLALLGALWGRGSVSGAGPKRGRSWRTSQILAANLAISDLLFLGALPLWIHSEANNGEWSTGETSCKLAPYVTAVTMHVGVLLMTVMSIDRFVAVVHAGLYRRVRKQGLVLGSCALCWLGSALLALPVLRVRQLQRAWPDGPAYCGENDGGAAAYPPGLSLALLLLTFFLPLLLILSCYCSLAQALRRHARGVSVGGAPGSPASLRRALRMVMLVAGAFLLCWLPFNSCKLLGALERCLAPPPRCALRGVAHAGMYWAAPLGFAHSCLNPLAYAAADRSLRRQVLQGKAWPCRWRKDAAVGVARGGASSLTTPTTWGEGGGDRVQGGTGDKEE